jgi:hypothetical protein
MNINEMYLVTVNGKAYFASYEKGEMGRPVIKLFAEAEPPKGARRKVERAIVRERESNG